MLILGLGNMGWGAGWGRGVIASCRCFLPLPSRGLGWEGGRVIRPHSFGGEGVLIGVQTATLNA